jgi:hypothetical protein
VIKLVDAVGLLNKDEGVYIEYIEAITFKGGTQLSSAENDV